MIYKIYDESCQICEETSLFDQRLCDKAGLELVKISLDEIVRHRELFEYVVESCLNEDDTVTLPCYIALGEDGSFSVKSRGLVLESEFPDLLM